MAAPTEQASAQLSHAHEQSLSGQIINPLQNQPRNNFLYQWLPLMEHAATLPLTNMSRHFKASKQPML